MPEFLFSVVVPIYNCESYLRETIESVINQTLGFREHIQLILINDGSTDKSEEICKSYRKRFPENIIYKKNENNGVSGARNLGLEFAVGQYINFLDADDRWKTDAFARAETFFERDGEAVDVLAARVRFFDKGTHFHPLDYKFKKGSRIVDLDDEAEVYSFQTTAATTFIRRASIGSLRFDPRLKHGEDSTFINKLILQKKRYAVDADILYYYRKRQEGDSAVNTQKHDRSYYFESLEYYHQELENYSRALFGEVIPYIQAVVAYDMGRRMADYTYYSVLSAEECRQYEQRRKEVLAPIADSIIIHSPTHKSMIRVTETLRLKNEEFLKQRVFSSHEATPESWRATAWPGGLPFLACILDFIEPKEGVLRIEGRIPTWPYEFGAADAPELFLSSNGAGVPAALERYKQMSFSVGEEVREEFFRFTCTVKLDGSRETTIKAKLLFRDKIYPVAISADKFVASAENYPPMYRFFGPYCLRVFKDRVVYKKHALPFLAHLGCELRYWGYSLTHGRKYLIKIRGMYYLRRLLKGRKKLWLFSDRMDNAGDNGEVFFRYVCRHCPPHVEPVFAIGKNAACLPRLRAEGKLVYFGTREYRYDFLLADKILSSGAAEFTLNAWGTNRQYLIDLYRFRYYYLQHGVACADLSSWLNKTNKNLGAIFTSAVKETEAFRTDGYYYSPDQIRLTGMARLDALRNGDARQILIMPTWRKSIRESYDSATNSVYFEGFRDTEYFRFYNSLINDGRLLSAMRRMGYRGLFCLHPIHQKQYVDFQGNDVFKINEGFVDYNQCFEDSSLMVTDYSSVLFDFAYLRKPVIYAQFDKEQFFIDQTYDKGYFDYEEDGFGPVCYDYESTVAALVQQVESGCVNLEKYRERENTFFYFSDQNNCERILESILEEEKERQRP